MYLIILIFSIFTDRSYTLKYFNYPSFPTYRVITPIDVDMKALPEPYVELLKPEGFLVSIPGKYDLRYFQFYGSINRPFNDSRPAVNSSDLFEEIWDRNLITENWTYENREIKLEPNDIVFYWLFIVMKDNKCFWLYDRLSKATVSLDRRYFRMIDGPPPTTSDYYSIYQRVRKVSSR